MIPHLLRIGRRFDWPIRILLAGMCLAIGLWWLGDERLLLGCTLLLLIVLSAAGAATWERLAAIAGDSELLTLPLALARGEQVLDLFRSMGRSMREISSHFDPIYRDLAVERTSQLQAELGHVARGQIVCTGTETWRRAYERLLRSRGLYLYRSVAYLKTANYWQDEPGRQSRQVNFTLCSEGSLNIERIAIVLDHLLAQWGAIPN